MDYDRCAHTPPKSVERKNIVSRISKQQKPRAIEAAEVVSDAAAAAQLSDLSPDCLERIACCLDTKSAVSLLQTCRTVYTWLLPCTHFWKHLCRQEGFDKYTALKKDDGEADRARTAWSGEQFHALDLEQEAVLWRKVFQRGLAMRRNLVAGRFEMWRLYMTDPASLPVCRLQRDTSSEVLRARHGSSPYNDTRRRVRVNRYWNEEFLIVIQQNLNRTFNDIFVWEWKECQSPSFLYSHDLLPLYPAGLFPTSFFLWKHFLVLMPDTGYHPNQRSFLSMVRVHDLRAGFQLVGSADLPEDGAARRELRVGAGCEAAHLHRLGDRAVALCRTPKLTLHIYSLPDCRLLTSLPLLPDPARPLDTDELDQRFLMRDNTMMFMFHDPEFFDHLFTPSDGEEQQLRYGRLLQVDFESYVKEGGRIEQRLDNKFDSNEDYIEKISLLGKNKMTCALASGKIVVRDILQTNPATLQHVDTLTIPCSEAVQGDYDEEQDEEVDTDGPSLCCTTDGELTIALRHFETGRKIHCYNRAGGLLYELLLDTEELGLEPRPGYLTLDLDNNFLCAADQNKIVLWNSRTGRHVRTISLPRHYDYQEDLEESQDKFCWKGHTDFAFTEDGIIIIHSQRNFPIAADILLFW